MTHLQLASQLTPVEKPSDFELACRMLRDNLRSEPHAYFLWTDGSWCHAHIDDIMRRANVRLKSMGRPQFTGKAEWRV
jgi:hypothetical protein